MTVDQPIPGGGRLIAEQPGDDQIERWFGEDARGAPREFLRLRPSAEPRPGAARDFARVHQALQALVHPALITPERVESLGDGSVLVARDSVPPPGTAGLTDTRYSPVQIAAIGARLAEAIVATGAASGGTFTLDDVRYVEGRGWCWAPIARPVPPARFVAPGAARPAPSAADALYGLGVALYQLLTGQWPPRGVPPQPPSVARPLVPRALDEAILALLSDDPAARGAAVASLQLLTPGILVPPPPPALPRVSAARTRALRGARADRRADQIGAVAVLPLPDAGSLSPSQRALVAGLAGLDEQDILDAIDRGEAVLIAAAEKPAHLDALLAALAAQAGVHAQRVTAWPRRLQWASGLAGAAVAASAAAAGSALGAVFGDWTVPWTLAAVLMPVAVSAAAAWWVSPPATFAPLRKRALDRRHVLDLTHPSSLALRARVAALRVRTAASDLPTPAKADVYDRLRDVEAQIRAVDGVLGSVALGLEPGDPITVVHGDVAALDRIEQRALGDLAGLSAALQAVEDDFARLWDAVVRDTADLGALRRTLAHAERATTEASRPVRPPPIRE